MAHEHDKMRPFLFRDQCNTMAHELDERRPFLFRGQCKTIAHEHDKRWLRRYRMTWYKYEIVVGHEKERPLSYNLLPTSTQTPTLTHTHMHTQCALTCTHTNIQAHKHTHTHTHRWSQRSMGTRKWTLVVYNTVILDRSNLQKWWCTIYDRDSWPCIYGRGGHLYMHTHTHTHTHTNTHTNTHTPTFRDVSYGVFVKSPYCI